MVVIVKVGEEVGRQRLGLHHLCPRRLRSSRYRRGLHDVVTVTVTETVTAIAIVSLIVDVAIAEVVVEEVGRRRQQLKRMGVDLLRTLQHGSGRKERRQRPHLRAGLPASVSVVYNVVATVSHRTGL